MADKKTKFEQISSQKALEFLQIARDRQELVQLYHSGNDRAQFKILSVTPPTFILQRILIEPSQKATEPRPETVFLNGMNYLLQFEVDNTTYSGMTLVHNENENFTVSYTGPVNILNRRSDFRLSPPDWEHYSATIHSISQIPWEKKYEFQDLSLGGCKLMLTPNLAKENYPIGSELSGTLKFREETLAFWGLVKSASKKSIGIQFIRLSGADKNRLWSELMSWYRQRKSRYAA